jgi:hypothetical protein
MSFGGRYDQEALTQVVLVASFAEVAHAQVKCPASAAWFAAKERALSLSASTFGPRPTPRSDRVGAEACPSRHKKLRTELIEALREQYKRDACNLVTRHADNFDKDVVKKCSPMGVQMKPPSNVSFTEHVKRVLSSSQFGLVVPRRCDGCALHDAAQSQPHEA